MLLLNIERFCHRINVYMLAGGTFFPTLYGLTLKTLRKDYNYGLVDRDHFHYHAKLHSL